MPSWRTGRKNAGRSDENNLTTATANQTLPKAPANALEPGLIHRLRQVPWEPEPDQMGKARAISFAATAAYWETLHANHSRTGGWPLRAEPPEVRIPTAPPAARNLAANLGRNCAGLDVINASQLIGSLYTKMMPDRERSRLGAYHTPAPVCRRLIDAATEMGAEWRSNRVMDPACGAGAFLLPAAQRMIKHAPGQDAETVIRSVEDRLSGLDVDPFAAWLSQVFLDVLTIDLCSAAGRRLEDLVKTGNALEEEPEGPGFDLVIGNPPYGRTRLHEDLRRKFQRSLYGHANLYGVFTDLAVRLVKPGGLVAYVTPTSFLSGEYFKSLRKLLGTEAPPVSIEFIADRKGVFDDVLQETVLTVFQRGGQPQPSRVKFTSFRADGSTETAAAGRFDMPEDPEQPWMMPRSPDLAELAERAAAMPHRLSDHGYEVKTGPLVWNRHRDGLRERAGAGCHPLIWAEAIRPGGTFHFPAEKPSHPSYFRPEPGQEWLVTRSPCVLLQRTTSKEQERRLIAAELPAEIVDGHDGVVVENHLNVLRPRDGQPRISTSALAALLNSDVVDSIFRCINGSVAVSAYELEALPLPCPDDMARLEEAVTGQTGRDIVERTVESLYRGEEP